MSGRHPRALPRRKFTPTLCETETLEGRVVPSALATAAVVSATTTTLTTAANPAPFGATDLTATVTGASGTPTGTVTFFDGTTTIGTATLGTAGKASLDTDALLPGTHALTATYGGDARNAPSTSAALAEVVGKATPTIGPLTRTAQPVAGGVQLTFTASIGLLTFDVSPPPPTGTVIFYNGTKSIGSAPVTNGQATLTVTLPGPGSEQVTAIYQGDSNDNPAASPGPPAPLANPATTTTLTSAANPTAYNLGTQFTATVNPVVPPTGGTPLPTGTVSFYDGTTLLGSAPMLGNRASFVAPTLPAGTDAITATYGGDASYNPSTSAPLAQVVTSAETTTRLSVSSATSTYGIPVMLSASVNDFLSSADEAMPTGTVTFYDGTAPLATVPLNTLGSASFSTATLAAGTHPITATYSGDANDAASTAPAMTLTVAPAATTVALSAPTGPVASGQPVALVAYVTPTPAGTQSPTGMVSFYDGTTLLGSAPLSGGTATLNLASVPVGGQVFTAKYQGDGNFTAGTSAGAQVLSGTPNQIYLNQLYLDLLGRPIDSGGLSVWSSELNAGVSRDAVALAIEGSREFALTTLSNLTQSLIGPGQVPTAAMTSQALALQAKGEADPTALESIVLNSPGFFQAHGGMTPLGFVTGVSEAVTGQPPDPTLLPTLLNLADQKQRAAVIADVLASPAALSAEVTNDYNRYLGRAPEAGDVAYFVAQLQNGTSSAAVIAQFVSSPEYFNRALAGV